MLEHHLLAEVMQRPDDPETLRRFGQHAALCGKLDAAQSALLRAAELAPQDAEILAQLAHVFHDRCEWSQAQMWYDRALLYNPAHRLAHEGAAYTAQRLGDTVRAAYHRAHAFVGRALTIAPCRKNPEALRVLLVVSALGGNVDTSPYLSTDDVTVIKVVAEYLDDIPRLPAHDIVFQAIGDADRCGATLRAMLPRFPESATRLLNAPAAVLATARVVNAERLSELPGVSVPRLCSTPRSMLIDLLRDPARPWHYPLIIRSLGYHTGQHCELVRSETHVAEILASLPGDEIAVAEFIDLRDVDGWVRKYRVMTIGGRLYPVHLAMSRQWKVHYATSQTPLSVELQREEEVFLRDPVAALGTAAWESLQSIAKMLALEYGGIDFAIDREGRVVCFEANATMIAPYHRADPPYRRAAARRVHEAVAAIVTLA